MNDTSKEELTSDATASDESVVHTPGPWKVIDYGWNQGSCVNFKGAIVAASCGYEDDPLRIASAGMFGISGRSVLESKANARLIAAAPDLLKALRDIVEHQEMLGGSMPSATKLIAQNAIALVE